MKHDHDADDLLVLARRGDLPEADAKRLRDALAASGEARLLYEAGRAFDREAPVLTGDDERMEELVRAVQKRIRPKKERSKHTWALRLCVAAALIAGAAVGAGEIRSMSRSPVDPGAGRRSAKEEGEPAAVPPTTAAEPRTRDDLPKVDPPAESVGTLEAPPLPSSPVATAAAPHQAPSHHDGKTITPIAPAPPPSAPPAPPTAEVPAPSAPPGLTAAELFAAANRARMAGDAALAVRLSRELEERYPTSREAIATHLSLGLVYLQQGASTAALLEFRRYRAVGAAATMPEALWGEIRALRQLGRSDEERTVLKELLERYPSSAYGDAARRRLSDLR